MNVDRLLDKDRFLITIPFSVRLFMRGTATVRGADICVSPSSNTLAHSLHFGQKLQREFIHNKWVNIYDNNGLRSRAAERKGLWKNIILVINNHCHSHICS